MIAHLIFESPAIFMRQVFTLAIILAMRNPGQKRRILLASILKPVDEPRMFERIGQTLASQGYEVFIVGFPPTMNALVPGIHFLPHDKFQRISIGRIKVRFVILKKLFQIKPDVLIITTHELIDVALIYRLLSGRKIIYDVQENYFKNILYTNAWPTLLRPLIACAVWAKELNASLFFNKFFLAEKCYQSELGFIGKNAIVLENKCKVPSDFQRKPSNDSILLVFTGTMAESTGIFEVIALAKKLNAINDKIHLRIVGYCSQSDVLKRISHEIAGANFISLIGGNEFVAHGEIMNEIASAHFGIIYYPPSKHTENRIPSKLYEYLALGLPIVIQDHKPWVDLCAPHQIPLVIDFISPDIPALLKKMNATEPHPKRAESALWKTEEPKLVDAIDSII